MDKPAARSTFHAASCCKVSKLSLLGQMLSSQSTSFGSTLRGWKGVFSLFLELLEALLL